MIFYLRSRPDKKDHSGAEYVNVVGNTFFEERMGIPMITGRDFGPQDTGSSLKVAVPLTKLWRSEEVSPHGSGGRNEF